MSYDINKIKNFYNKMIEAGHGAKETNAFIKDKLAASKEEAVKVEEKVETEKEAETGFEEQIKAYQGGMSLKDVPIEERAGVVSEMEKRGITYEPDEERKNRIKMEQEYVKVQASLGNMLKEFKSIPENQRGPFQGVFSKRAPFGLAAEATEYEEARAGFAGTLKAIVGEVGRLTDDDVKRIMNILPTVTDTSKQAKISIDRINKILADIYGKELTGKEEEKPEDKGSVDEGLFKEEGKPPKPLDIKGIGRKVSEAAPMVGGIVGGTTGAFLGLGVGSLFTGAAGTAIGTGAGIAFGETLQDLLGIQDETPPEQLKKGIVYPATAAALDLAFGAVFMGGATVIKALGKKIFGLGDDLALRAIRPSPSQQKNFFKRTGIKLKDFVVEKGLFSRGVAQTDELITPLQKSFDDIAVNSGKQVEVKAVTAAFDDKIAQFNDIPTKKAQQIAKNLIDEKKLFVKKYGGKIALDVGDITNLRRTIDNLVGTSKWIADPISAGTERSVRQIYQDTVRGATEELTDSAGRSLKGIGQELRSLYEFRDIALMQEGLGKGTLPMGLLRTISTTIGGGAGFAYGRDPKTAIKGALAGYGFMWAANNPKIISYVTKTLLSTGKGLENLPDKQKLQIFTGVFRRLLSSVAAMKMTHFGYEEEETPMDDLFAPTP